ncbi:MAG: phosphonatase-like hydrolase [Fuerstiella sp.]|jgi:phosphonatase-like hydrolase|nr:phosphonatase-like hydrolase [Fuerstiella sp.]MDG2127228.1 phosphonatase-like hydrolase [Fuerstiella sp.]
MIKLVVFDMAGTTVDEDNVVYKTVRAAINAAGYEFTQEQVQSAGAGKEKSQAIRDVLALDGQVHEEDEVAAIFRDFKLRLANAYESLKVTEQQGTSDVFAALRDRGIRVVLNTGYDRTTAEGLVAKIGWHIGDDIDGLVTASDVENGRPAPDMILRAMADHDVESSEDVAKIGDSAIDIEEGKNAGCGMTFGVTTGAQTESQLRAAAPTHVVNSLEQMLNLILAQPSAT